MKKCDICQSIVIYKTKIDYNKNGKIRKIWLTQECNCLSHSVSLDYAIENGELYSIGRWNEKNSKVGVKGK